MTVPAWRWIKESSVLAIHDEQIAEHGGLAGVRDLPLLHSELAPQNLEGCGSPDLADLAAAYAVGITLNRAFLDGNKRTAFLTGFVFLYENGRTILAEQAEVIAAMLSLADHTLDETGYAAWLREHTAPNQS